MFECQVLTVKVFPADLFEVSPDHNSSGAVLLLATTGFRSCHVQIVQVQLQSPFRACMLRPVAA